jgi:hypothetical protein
MNLILVVVVLLILFGGGGFYYGGPYVGGGLGTILLIVLIVLLLRGYARSKRDRLADRSGRPQATANGENRIDAATSIVVHNWPEIASLRSQRTRASLPG